MQMTEVMKQRVRVEQRKLATHTGKQSLAAVADRTHQLLLFRLL